MLCVSGAVRHAGQRASVAIPLASFFSEATRFCGIGFGGCAGRSIAFNRPSSLGIITFILHLILSHLSMRTQSRRRDFLSCVCASIVCGGEQTKIGTSVLPRFIPHLHRVAFDVLRRLPINNLLLFQPGNRPENVQPGLVQVALLFAWAFNVSLMEKSCFFLFLTGFV